MSTLSLSKLITQTNDIHISPIIDEMDLMLEGELYEILGKMESVEQIHFGRKLKLQGQYSEYESVVNKYFEQKPEKQKKKDEILKIIRPFPTNDDSIGIFIISPDELCKIFKNKANDTAEKMKAKLFHGTDENLGINIVKEGLIPGSTGGMIGHGVYTSPDPEKASDFL